MTGRRRMAISTRLKRGRRTRAVSTRGSGAWSSGRRTASTISDRRASASWRGPVAAQNGRYLRYQTLYNRTMFDAIVANKFYLRDHLPVIPSPRPETPVFQFPNGSMAIKAAWLDMAGFSGARRKRFYTRTRGGEGSVVGEVRDGDGGTRGLAHRAEDSEPAAVDLVVIRAGGHGSPNFQGDGRGTFTLNDGTPGAMPGRIRWRSCRWRSSPRGRSM